MNRKKWKKIGMRIGGLKCSHVCSAEEYKISLFQINSRLYVYARVHQHELVR